MVAILKFIYAMFLFISLFLLATCIDEYIDCIDVTQCQEKYKCAPELDLKCIDSWCHCKPK